MIVVTREVCSLVLIGITAVGAGAAEPTRPYIRKKPKSPAELVAEDATTAPTHPATTQAAVNPFATSQSRPEYAVPGVVRLSNGLEVPGYIWTPSGKEWRVYERASKQYRDIPFDAVKSIEGVVEWERMEDDWRWKEGGSDVKVLTGHRYPNRKTYFKFVLTDDREIVGDIAQMFYVELGGRLTNVTLHKRQEGRIGATLESMPYVRQVVLGADAMEQALRRIAATRTASQPNR